MGAVNGDVGIPCGYSEGSRWGFGGRGTEGTPNAGDPQDLGDFGALGGGGGGGGGANVIQGLDAAACRADSRPRAASKMASPGLELGVLVVHDVEIVCCESDSLDPCSAAVAH